MVISKLYRRNLCEFYRSKDFNPATGFPFKRVWRPIDPRTGYPAGYEKQPPPWTLYPDPRLFLLCPGEEPPPPPIVLTWGGEPLTWGGDELKW